MARLVRSFYLRPPLLVARDLLGMHLCHRLPEGPPRSGRIVEVEAYLGPEDRASHAKLRKGRAGPTPRAALMFGEVGHAYVYLIYGRHCCFNAVCHDPGAVGAVLVRALEPDAGLAGANCRGPARLCAVLGIDRSKNGLDLCASDGQAVLTIEDRGTPVADADVLATPRIGVDYAGPDALLPYRLCDAGSAHLSRRAALR